MRFRFKLINNKNEIIFNTYDTSNSTLLNHNNEIVKFDKIDIVQVYEKKITIQLGFSCNMKCSYCLQSKTKKDTFDESRVIELLEKLKKEDIKNCRIEFWGGEPLLYLDEIKYIVEKLHMQPYEYLIITNGTKLTIDLAKWFIDNNFAIALSHDSIAQDIRGINPFDIPAAKDAVKYLIDNHNKFSINSVITNNNLSTKKRLEYFSDILNVSIDKIKHSGEGAVYNTFLDLFDMNDLSEKVFDDLLEDGLKYGHNKQLVMNFINSLATGKSIDTITTKCGIDNPNKYKIYSLNGKDLSCHNYDYKFTINAVNDKGSCYKCPVVHICKGSCPAIQKDTEMFRKNCDTMRAFYFPIIRYVMMALYESEYQLIDIAEV